MKVSIALAARNGEKYIYEQLQSINEQLYLPNELIISDDCSTDNTLEIVNKFIKDEAKFPVTVLKNANQLGVNKNFERAFFECTGDLIFISDQDDKWFSTKILEVMNSFKKNELIKVIINDQIISNEDLSKNFGSKIKNIKKLLLDLDRNFCTGSCTAIKKDWLDFCLPIQGQYDVWINRLSLAYGVRKIIEMPLQIFRRHENNVSDWIASSPKKITFLDTISIHRNNVRSLNLNQELELLKNIEKKFNQSDQLFDKAQIKSQKARFELLLNYTQDRIKLIDQPYYKKFIKILIFVFYKKYYYYLGWQRLLKDIII
ncbi:glycosyltransferase [Gammaproteobacteria bacterium]|nr:glycosyltransferase [Gammaproteobacteria bacterium]